MKLLYSISFRVFTNPFGLSIFSSFSRFSLSCFLPSTRDEEVSRLKFGAPSPWPSVPYRTKSSIVKSIDTKSNLLLPLIAKYNFPSCILPVKPVGTCWHAAPLPNGTDCSRCLLSNATIASSFNLLLYQFLYITWWTYWLSAMMQRQTSTLQYLVLPATGDTEQ